MNLKAMEIESVHSMLNQAQKNNRDRYGEDRPTTVMVGKLQAMLLRMEMARDPRNPYAPMDKPFDLGELMLYGFYVASVPMALNYLRFV